jgi:hypothetical protein
MIFVRIFVETVALKFSPVEACASHLALLPAEIPRATQTMERKGEGLSGAFWYLLGK